MDMRFEGEKFYPIRFVGKKSDLLANILNKSYIPPLLRYTRSHISSSLRIATFDAAMRGSLSVASAIL